MRLIEILPNGELRLTRALRDNDLPAYAILSHTWGDEREEVTFEEMEAGKGRDKAGFEKIRFCSRHAEQDGLGFFWVDSCCIKKSSDAELSESLNSMFRWYQQAARCYVYLPDVTASNRNWQEMFRRCRWFTRGWTLQELLAPSSLQFFAHDARIGDRKSLLVPIHETTGIPIPALMGVKLVQYTPEEKFSWSICRQTLREEDLAYSLLGICGVSMPIIYGEGKENAFRRLKKELTEHSMGLAHIGFNQELASDIEMIGSVSALVAETRQVFRSENALLQRQLAEAYRIIAHQRTMLQRLSSIVERYEGTRYDSVAIRGGCSKNHAESSNPDAEKIRSLSDLFFTCVSMFSSFGYISGLIAKLSIMFAGSAEYTHERSAAFHPQRYVARGLFAVPLFVLATKESCEEDKFTQTYYVFYARTPRDWYWLVVTATWKGSGSTKVPQVSATDSHEITFKALPITIINILQAELPQIHLYSSVTRISVSLDSVAFDQTSPSARIESSEDRVETQIMEEQNLLHVIQDLGCTVLTPSQVEVYGRKSATCFSVKVGGRRCMERKRPFAFVGQNNETELTEFIHGLKICHALRDCKKVARFVGVVVEDGLRLKSYLYEAPIIFPLTRVLYARSFESEIISWEIRELWATQIASALAHIHNKGFNVGFLSRSSIGIHADGSAVLHTFRSLKDDGGRFELEYLPPELPFLSSSTSLCSNQSTDMYQFGACLWLLVEKKPNFAGLRCQRSACTSFPRYQCTAAHANARFLPPALSSHAPHILEIIEQCRSSDPRERPTSQCVSDVLAPQCRITRCPRDVLDLLKKYGDKNPFLCYCTECGDSVESHHFHCDVCHSANFDLCLSCVTKGIHCEVKEHVLVERISTSDGYMHVN